MNSPAVHGYNPAGLDSDVQIAGDPLALPHLLPAVPEHPSTVAGFAGLARDIAADRASWAPVVRYDAASRWYHRLRTGPGYEVWLLSWLPGQGSGAHDHGPSSGVLTVLDGELTEHSGVREHSGPRDHSGVRDHSGAQEHPGARRRSLAPGAQRVIAPGHVHEVVNDALVPAVSLHVYFPGLTEMPMHPSDPAPARSCAPAAALRSPLTG